MQILKTATGIRLIIPGIHTANYSISVPAHVAITRQGSTFTVWVNGNAIDTFVSTKLIPSDSSPLRIGSGGFVLDEIRLTSSALYTAAFVPPEVAHQAWYQGNPIFAKGQIKQGQQLNEGQIGGAKGSITDGSVSPNAQSAGTQGSIKTGEHIIPPVIIPAQDAGTQGSITQGNVVIFGIYPGQRESSKGIITQGDAPIFGDKWTKGILKQGDAPDPIPYDPGPPVLVAGQRQYAKGIPTFGGVILFDGTKVVPSQQQFSEGSITFGKPDIRGNPVIANKQANKQGSFLSNTNTPPYQNKLITGQGDALPPYTGWNPADRDRIMEALGIPITADNLERTQQRLNEILAISTQGQKRIQTLLAHRDGLWLELTRTLAPNIRNARGTITVVYLWQNVHRSRLINKEQRIVRRQIEVASGIPDRLKQIPIKLV